MTGRQMQAGGVRISFGDVRCLTNGHLTRLAITFSEVSGTKIETLRLALPRQERHFGHYAIACRVQPARKRF